MQRYQVLFISLIILVFAQISASQTDMVQQYRINMAKYAKVIVEGSVTDITEVKDSHNDINRVVTVRAIDVIAGKTNPTITIKYIKNWVGDALWAEPQFNVGDTFIAFLGKNDKYYTPLGGGYGIFKVCNEKMESSDIDKSRFCQQITDVRASRAESMVFPEQDRLKTAINPTGKLSNEFVITNSNFYGPSNGVTIEFHINPHGAKDKNGNQLSFQAVKSAIQRAVDTWNNVSHSYATFSVSNIEYTGNRDDYDEISTITFENLDSFGGSSINQRYADLDSIHVVDIIFCGGCDWGSEWRSIRWNTDINYPTNYSPYPCPFPNDLVQDRSDIGPVDLEDVAVHELGHGLGLQHSYKYHYSMCPTDYSDMTGWWWKKTWRRSLEVGDKAGKIYQDPDFSGSATQANAKVLISSRATTTFDGTFTVPSGCTFYAEGGKTLVFDNGASLVINGAFSVEDGAVGTPVTIDFLSPNSSTQNGVKFNSGSSGSIDYCQIRNAYRGVYQNNVNVDITNSAISNCTNGIYLYSSSPDIENCNIHNNSNSGIYLLYSSPVIDDGNYIQNNNYGIYSLSYSHPEIGNYLEGNNISNNNYGVTCYNNSSPKIGDPSGNGGYNNLVNSSYNVFNTTGLLVYARMNWWGTTNQANFKIMGNVSYSPYLASARTISAPPLSKAVINDMTANDDIPMLSELDKAYRLLAENYPEGARKICMNLINNYPDYTVAGNALLLLQETFSANERTAIKDIYRTLFNNKSKKELYAMAGLIMANLDRDNKLEWIDTVIKSYEGEPIEEQALFDKFVYYQFELADTKNAVMVSKELDAKFPLSTGAIEAHKIMGDESWFRIKPVEKLNHPQINHTIQSYQLYANYPNPFNPVTRIKYAVPRSGLVTIRVYNILGKQVATLVNERKTAGEYEVLFDGTDLASGVYLYTMQAGNFTDTRKFILMK